MHINIILYVNNLYIYIYIYNVVSKTISTPLPLWGKKNPWDEVGYVGQVKVRQGPSLFLLSHLEHDFTHVEMILILFLNIFMLLFLCTIDRILKRFMHCY